MTNKESIDWDKVTVEGAEGGANVESVPDPEVSAEAVAEALAAVAPRVENTEADEAQANALREQLGVPLVVAATASAGVAGEMVSTEKGEKSKEAIEAMDNLNAYLRKDSFLVPQFIYLVDALKKADPEIAPTQFSEKYTEKVKKSIVDGNTTLELVNQAIDNAEMFGASKEELRQVAAENKDMLLTSNMARVHGNYATLNKATLEKLGVTYSQDDIMNAFLSADDYARKRNWGGLGSAITIGLTLETLVKGGMLTKETLLKNKEQILKEMGTEIHTSGSGTMEKAYKDGGAKYFESILEKAQ